jgi:hypothetical protein
MMPETPKPNTQALSWFYGEYKKDTLLLDPKYQRNPIWSIGQKCFLIDSLISGCPIPQVYLNIVSRGSGVARKTVYEVVDGQQRLRAILEYMNDQYALVETTARSYPVSVAYKPHIGSKFSELPSALQDAIWNYQLAVQELRGWDPHQIRALFRRLNYVVEKLNAQEMRHSQYFGEFVNTVERLADDRFWDDVALFSRRDSQRMRDIEFVSELFVLLMNGPQDGQSTLDKFYADNDVAFPHRARYSARFRAVLKSLTSISKLIADSRFKKRADFYGLFGATSKLLGGSRQARDLKHAVPSLRSLDQALSQPNTLSGDQLTYYNSVVEGPNKISKRKDRIGILLQILTS